MKLLVLWTACLCAASFNPTRAAVIRIPLDQPGIQAGIDDAAAGDTVLVAPGLYVEWMIVMKSGVKLLSQASDPDLTIINGMGNDAVIHCEDVDATASVEGFTIKGGAAQAGSSAAGDRDWESGGGMHCKNSSLLIRNCIFRNNRARFGGGLACDWSDVLVKDCVFRDNTAFEEGGGVDCYDCAPMFVRCRFENNQSYWRGGGLGGYRSSLTAEYCSFVGNEAGDTGTGIGGGALLLGTSQALFSHCLFLNNHCGHEGGGFGAMGGEHTFISCEFQGNGAPLGGGAYLLRNTGSFMGCTFTGNSAKNGGAILLRLDCSPSLYFCTLVENQASQAGAGLAIMDLFNQGLPSFPYLEFCLIAFNARAEAVHCDATGKPTLSCCNLFGNKGGDWTGYIASQATTSGNLTEDPQLCGSLGSGNFLLQSDSPCAGANNECGLDIGAHSVGCEETAASPVSWSALKAFY